MKITTFEEIESWKEARVLTKQIYRTTTMSRLSKDFGLRDQMQRASVSIMANIAEGFDAGSRKSFVGFLSYAYRSTSELQSLLYVAADLSYVEHHEFEQIYHQAMKTKKLIGGLMRYLRGSNPTH